MSWCLEKEKTSRLLVWCHVDKPIDRLTNFFSYFNIHCVTVQTVHDVYSASVDLSFIYSFNANIHCELPIYSEPISMLELRWMRHKVLALRALVLGRWICKYRQSLHFSVYNLVWEVQYMGGVPRRERAG